MATELIGRLGRVRPNGEGLRCNPGRRGVVAMVTVAAVVVLGVGCWLVRSRPQPAPLSSTVSASDPASVAPGGTLQSPVRQSPVSGTAADPSAAGAPPSGSVGVNSTSGSANAVVVDVVGKVRHPGVYRLSTGARVQDAVIAAGGVLAGVDPISVNLARKVADGEQIVIGLPPTPAGAESAASGGQPTAAPTPAGTSVQGSAPVDLNTASADQLDALPGVGPVLAQRIIDWRSAHGRFASVEQLQSVSGIGDAKFADLKPLVTVS